MAKAHNLYLSSTLRVSRANISSRPTCRAAEEMSSEASEEMHFQIAFWACCKLRKFCLRAMTESAPGHGPYGERTDRPLSWVLHLLPPNQNVLLMPQPHQHGSPLSSSPVCPFLSPSLKVFTNWTF